MNNNQQIINISTSTIFRFILILLGFIFLYIIADILLTVFIAIIIAAAANGPIVWLQQRKIPRILGVVFVYLFALLILALIVTLIFPTLAEQVKHLADVLPDFINKTGLSIQKWWSEYKLDANLQSFLNGMGNSLSQSTEGIFNKITGFFGGIFSALLVLVISIYLSLQEKGIKGLLLSLTPSEHRDYLSNLIDQIQSKIGKWLRGQILLMIIIGVLTFIGLSLLGVEYALALALLAGLLEIIPYVGPILAAIPAAILAFFQYPFLALLVIILYIVIQQLENYVLVPQVMKKTIGLNPVVIIIVMLIGAKLAGIIGIVLSVPLAASISEFFKSIRRNE